ncbi:ROK family transcriptional regulator [Streptomyces hirsutus]
METPGSQSSLHRANLERVVRAVRLAGSLTQAEIARATGLSAATVSNIVRELKESGTVEVTPTSSGGRRARSVSLSGDAGIVVGVDFGHTHLRVAVGNLAHQVLAEEAEPLDVDASSTQGFDRAEQLVNRLIEATGVDRTKSRRDRSRGARPHRRGVRHPGLDRDPARLDRHQARRGAAGAARRARARGQRREPGRPRRDGLGRGRGVRDLAYIKVASGVGAGVSLTQENINDTVIKDGVYTVDCAGKYKAACDKIGLKDRFAARRQRGRTGLRRGPTAMSSGRRPARRSEHPPYSTTSRRVRRRRRWFTCPLRPCWRCAGSPSDSVPSRRSPT